MAQVSKELVDSLLRQRDGLLDMWKRQGETIRELDSRVAMLEDELEMLEDENLRLVEALHE